MAIFKSGNPALDKETFLGFEQVGNESDVMTLQGTVNKTALLLALVFASSLYPWKVLSETSDVHSMVTAFFISLFGAALIGFWIAHNKDHSALLAPLYAILEGFVLGVLSSLLEKQYHGIVFESLVLTFGITACLLVIYKFELIKPSENRTPIITSAMSGVALYYAVAVVMSFFGVNVPLINDNTFAGILFSLLVVVLASMNLVVDFDFIEDGVSRGCPKYMEWYGAFGIMVTIIWLYIEILRLLAKSRRR